MNCKYDLTCATQQTLEIALDLRLELDNRQALLNPPRDKTRRLGKDDQVIVLVQQL